MNRRVVRRQIEVQSEVRSSQTRHLPEGAVLNMLQPHLPGIARFTIEGEGATIWCCPEPAILGGSDAVGPAKS